MSLSEADFDYVRALVRDRSAIVLEDNKAYLAESRIAQVARAEGYASTDELVAKLRLDRAADLQRKVVEAMTTNETSFFRDIHPFEALRREIVPKLIEQRKATRTLNVWSAASSSGQEAYTIAILLSEHFPELAGWNVRILGTDLSNEMVARSSEGRYSKIEVNRGMPAQLLLKYFTRDGLHWTVKNELKKLVDFRQMNLAQSWPALPPMDVVFLRNVLIYFDVATKKEILQRLRRVLRADGYLFLGGAETTLNLDDSYQRTQIDKASVYRPCPL